MTLPKQEAFTDSASTQLPTHDANWKRARTTAFTNAIISGSTNSLQGNDTITQIYIWDGDTFDNDQYAQCKDVAVGDYHGCLVRGANISDVGYMCEATNGDRYIEKTPGTFTVLYNDAGALAVNDIQYISAVGTTITYKINGSTVQAVTDNSYTSGKAGLTISSTSSTNRIDDWEGGNVTAAANLPPGLGPAMVMEPATQSAIAAMMR